MSEPAADGVVILPDGAIRIAPPAEYKELQPELLRQIVTAQQIYFDLPLVPDAVLARTLGIAAFRLRAAATELNTPHKHWVLPTLLTSEQMEARVMSLDYLDKLARAATSAFQFAKQGHPELARDGGWVIGQRIRDSLSGSLTDYFATPSPGSNRERLN